MERGEQMLSAASFHRLFVWRITGLTAVLFLALFPACRQEAGKGLEEAPPPRRRPDLLTINKAPEHSPYQLRWGPIRVPLRKIANPNVYGGEVEVGLNEFWTALDSRLELFRQNERLDLELVSINREPWSWRRRLWFSYPKLQKGLLEAELVDQLRHALRRGEQLNLRLRSAADSAQLHPVIIRVRDPFAPYQPEVAVDRRRDDGDIFGFQMIQLPGKPPLLRLDTTSERTRHIYDMYVREPAYHIIHVPGFTTRRRYISEADELFPTKDIRKTVLLCQPYDLLTLPEFVQLGPGGARLSWGDLEAAPASPPLSLEDIRTHQGRELALWVNGRRLPVRNFHLYLSSRRLRPNLFIGDDIQAAEIQRALARLQPESTVYFDHLVTEDSSGRALHLRGAFSFIVGAEPEYDLHIAESGPGTRPARAETIERRRRHFSLQGQAFADVLAYLLDVPVEKVLFEHFSGLPRLDGSFDSPRLSIGEGKQLMLAKLQEIYHFTLEAVSEENLYFLEISNEAELDAHRSTLFSGEDGPRTFSFSAAAGRRTVQFRGARTTELTRFLRNEFRILIVDRTGRPEARFDWQLPVQSLDDTRGQLAALGLRLSPVEGEVRYVVSRW